MAFVDINLAVIVQLGLKNTTMAIPETAIVVYPNLVHVEVIVLMEFV